MLSLTSSVAQQELKHMVVYTMGRLYDMGHLFIRLTAQTVKRCCRCYLRSQLPHLGFNFFYIQSFFSSPSHLFSLSSFLLLFCFLICLLIHRMFSKKQNKPDHRSSLMTGDSQGSPSQPFPPTSPSPRQSFQQQHSQSGSIGPPTSRSTVQPAKESKNRLSFFGRNKDKDKGTAGPQAGGGKMSRTTSRFSVVGSQQQQQQQQQLELTGVGQDVGLGATRSGEPTRQMDLRPQSSTGDYASSFGSSITPPPATNAHQLRAQQQAYLQNGNITAQQQQQQKQQQQLGHRASASVSSSLMKNPALQSAVDLISLHPNKIYATSPPILKVMTAAGPDGKHPKNGPPGTPGNDWQEAWIELRGVILHTWIMSEVQEANARGEDKHPTRTNITDAFVDLIQPLPPTKHNPQAGPHPFVFSVNTAGMNSVLFSCPNQEIMHSWVTAIRLAGWESSRLMEIYTGHLLQTTGVHPAPLGTTNRLAGWFDVRTFGSRQWTHFYVVLSVDLEPIQTGDRQESISENSSVKDKSLASSAKSKNRLSRMFGGSNSTELGTTPYPPAPGEGSPIQGNSSNGWQTGFTGQRTVTAQFFKQPPPSKQNSRNSVAPPIIPFLTVTDVFQALAVFPEVEQEIENSAMFKIEGKLSGEGMGRVRRDEGWILMIPMEEDPNGEGLNIAKRGDMIKWLTAFHDAFELYGRPGQYSWDARDPKSMFFTHPNGPSAEDFFLTNPVSNPDEISISRPSFVRSRFQDILIASLSDNFLPSDSQSRAGPAPAPAPTSAPISSPTPIPLSVPAPTALPVTLSSPVLHSSAQQGQFIPPSKAAQQQQYQQHQSQQALASASPPLRLTSREPFDAREGEREREQEARRGARMTAKESSPNPSQAETERNPHIPPSTFLSDRGQDQNRNTPQLTLAPVVSPVGATERVRSEQQQQPQNVLAQNSVPPRMTLQTENKPVSFHNIEKSSSLSRKSHPPSTVIAAEDEGPILAYTASPINSPHLQMNPTSSPPLSPRSGSRVNTSGRGSINSLPNREKDQSMESSRMNTASGFSSSMYSQSSAPSVSATTWTQRSNPTSSPISINQLPSPQPLHGENSLTTTGGGHERDLNAPLAPLGPTTSGTARVDRYQQEQQKISGAEDMFDHPGDESSNGHSFVPLEMIETGLPTEEELIARAQAEEARLALIAQNQQQQTQLAQNQGVLSSKKERVNLGRRPSGARAAPPRRTLSESATSMATVSDDDNERIQYSQADNLSSGHDSNDHNADALAALSFLDSPSSPEIVRTQVSPQSQPALSKIHTEEEPELEPTMTTATATVPYPSSFGPSKSAAERKARLEAAQQQHQDMLTRPGKARSGGGGGGQMAKKPVRAGAWASSSDEDEEEDDDDEDSPVVQKVTPRPLPTNPSMANNGGRPMSTMMSQSQSQIAQQRGQEQGDFQSPSPAFLNSQRPGSRNSERGGSLYGQQPAQSYYQDRDEFQQPVSRQAMAQGNARGMSQGRASVWNAHLEMAHGGKAEQDSNKFVTMEEPEVKLTKAFNPNGLLQAGLEDRDDRSAKRQEEVARSSGVSLINVPAPPPPPQTGLLGAITAHERDRARDGGVGAVLTEKERDRRLAEERAQKIDILQREQLEAMSQAGGGFGYNAYGAQGYNAPSPMMGGMQGMMPWGMGMPPPMSAYGGGYGMDPQAQMAAMMAAQSAYQQAMVSYSQAGSVMGGGGSGGGGGGNNAGENDQEQPNRYSSPLPSWGMPNLMPPQWGYPGSMMSGSQPMSPLPYMHPSSPQGYPGMASPVPMFNAGQSMYYPPQQPMSAHGGSGFATPVTGGGSGRASRNGNESRNGNGHGSSGAGTGKDGQS